MFTYLAYIYLILLFGKKNFFFIDEDVFGIINQDIYVQQNKNRKRYERDVMIVNLSKSYIINIEAKTNLGNCKRGAK